MAQRGQPSIAHEYDANGACIHCDMYKSNVDRMIHTCKPWRELEVDRAAALVAGVTLEVYRLGNYEVGDFQNQDVIVETPEDVASNGTI